MDSQFYCKKCIHYHSFKKTITEDVEHCHVKMDDLVIKTPLEKIIIPNIVTFKCDIQNKNNDCKHYVSAYKYLIYVLILAGSVLILFVSILQAIGR